MQCPSCKFENMPGLQQCVVCSTSLTASPEQESVMPPRARNRGFGDRVRIALDNAPALMSLRRWLSTQRQRALGSTLTTTGWSWLTPGAFGLIVLSAIPGFPQAFIMRCGFAGLTLFLAAMASLLLGACFYKTAFCDWMLWSVLALSAWSMLSAADYIRPGSRVGRDRYLALAGLCMLVVSIYAGGYLTLRLALSPVVSIVRLQVPLPGCGLQAGDSILTTRRSDYRRGDVIVAQVRWQDYAVPNAGRIIGMPGDVLTLRDRLYVNGRPVEARLPQPLRQDEPVPAYEEGRIRLKANQYWVAPAFNVSPSPQELLDTGRISRDDISGRVSAITGPAHRRRWIPWTGEREK